MALTLSAAAVPTPWLSPLVLADRLLTLAQEADRAGFQDTAGSLMQLVYAVLDRPAAPALPFMLAGRGGFRALPAL